MTIPQIYLNVIKKSISEDDSFQLDSASLNWDDFLKFCTRHGIAGLVYGMLERSETQVPIDTMLDWVGIAETIKKKNELINERTIQISSFFRKQKWNNCILKGQANSLYYPNPELRTPGDIDIWIDGDTKDVIRLIHGFIPDAHISIHHVDFPVFSDVSVEVHYRPIYLTNWFVDRRLQRYVNRIRTKQFENQKVLGKNGESICCLTDDFNVVYLVLHMYAHFFTTRNSLKQLIDYYYLLKTGVFSLGELELLSLLKDLKIYKYSTGIMWIMQEVFGVDKSTILVEPNAKIGRIILSETLGYGVTPNTRFKTIKNRIWGNMRLIRFFPSEVIISPFFLLWHQVWKFKTKIYQKF